MPIKFKKINIEEFKNGLRQFSKNQSEKNNNNNFSHEDIKKHSGEIENNPYLQSRALWSDIYGNAEDRYKKSRQINFRLLILLGISLFGMIYIGAQSKFIPYVVEIQNGQVIYTSAVKSSNFGSMKPVLSKFFIQEFVKSARSVSVDGYVEGNDKKKSYAFTKSVAVTQLNDFYTNNDPYKVVLKNTISVKINYVNSLPNNIFQVGWTETLRDSQSGTEVSKQAFVGEFEYQWGKPSQDEYILKNNPFGFYVTNISWTGVK